MATRVFPAAVTATVPSSQVEISVSCRKLAKLDVMSKPDPICVLYTYDNTSGRYLEFGRTEVIKDNLDPDFVKKFVLSYFFEETQKLRFEIYDVDSPSRQLSQHDALGFVEITLGEIIGCNTLEKPLRRRGGATDYGTIELRAEELGPCKEIVTLQFRGIHLEKKEFFGKADPFLVFHRVNEDCSFTVFHKTEVIKNTLNPAWKPFTLPVQLICNGDYNRLIHVECLDWNRDGSHDLIGEFSTDMHHLVRGQGPENLYEVINPKKKSKKNYKGSGVIELVYSDIQVQHTFLDYIQGGMQMKFTVAIDFTASNGNPKNPTSLHYYSPYTLNQYSLAICAVGEIIQDYDSDRLFAAFGFGASLPDGNVSHKFPLNFNPSDPFCRGVEGLLEAYYNSLSRVELFGPTNFAPVINHVARIAAAKQDGSEYFVLLIITDGVITDMLQTIEAVVKASALPMSIIIVGVGNADFEDMNKLDGDVRLRIGGQNARRDIVQFVPIQQFLTPNQGATESCKAALAKEVLGEIPDQVLQYMKDNGIEPHRQPVPYNLSRTTDNSAAPPANVLGTPPPPYEP